MSPAIIALGCLLMITSSCKKTKDEGQICLTRTSGELKIENHTSKEFHFAAFDQTSLALINWGPFCTANNEIPADGTINQDLSAIYGYSEHDLLAVYWWECTENKAGEIQNVLLDKDQTVCK
jgi:hypothetical protein